MHGFKIIFLSWLVVYGSCSKFQLASVKSAQLHSDGGFTQLKSAFGQVRKAQRTTNMNISMNGTPAGNSVLQVAERVANETEIGVLLESSHTNEQTSGKALKSPEYIEDLFDQNLLLIHKTDKPVEAAQGATRNGWTGVSTTFFGTDARKKEAPKKSVCAFCSHDEPQPQPLYPDFKWGILLDMRVATESGALGAPSNLYSMVAGGGPRNGRFRDGPEALAFVKEYDEIRAAHDNRHMPRKTFAFIPREGADFRGLQAFMIKEEPQKTLLDPTEAYNELYLVSVPARAIVGLIVGPRTAGFTTVTEAEVNRMSDQLKHVLGRELPVMKYAASDDEWCPIPYL